MEYFVSIFFSLIRVILTPKHRYGLCPFLQCVGSCSFVLHETVALIDDSEKNWLNIAESFLGILKADTTHPTAKKEDIAPCFVLWVEAWYSFEVFWFEVSISVYSTTGSIYTPCSFWVYEHTVIGSLRWIFRQLFYLEARLFVFFNQRKYLLTLQCPSL